jgi:uncharacterized protein YdhG (YjbR/CyaY superfamily)
MASKKKPKKAPSQASSAPWRAGLAPDVDAYLAALPVPVRRALSTLRKTIRAAAPLSTELISYRVPTFKHHGALVAFSASPKHCALHVMSPTLMRSLSAELAKYDVGTATIRFTPEKPLPASLIAKLVKARIAENEQRGG